MTTLTGNGPRGMIVTSDLGKTPKRPKVKATPLAQKMAEDCGISLAEVIGTGPGGRITRDDVTKKIATLTRSTVASGTSTPPSRQFPLEGLRGLIAERLSASWNERPQVTLYSEVDATQLIELRQHNLTPNREKISINAYFFAAVSKALREFPFVNTQLTENGLVHINKINIGIAIDTERGLVVPVLKDVGRRSLLDIHDALNDLVQRTLSGKALPDDFIDGTFTITNLGAFGVDTFAPIINPPEAAILGVGRIKPKPVAIDRMIGIRDMVTLSLSFDHRLMDGAPAARFLNRICQFLEGPEELL
jgi:pyruvate dehydrogenase E2 component (dihydrolipoamide acetyltransferase)